MRADVAAVRSGASGWFRFMVGFRAYGWGLKSVLPGGPLFGRAVLPAAAALGVVLVLAGGAFALAHLWLSEWIVEQGWAEWLTWLGSVLIVVLALLAAWFLYGPVMSLFSPLLDPLALRATELTTGGKLQVDSSGSRFLGVFSSFFAQLGAAIFVQFPLWLLALLTGLGAVVAIPAGAAVAGWEALEGPLSLRGMGFGDRWRWCRRHLWEVAGLGCAQSLAMTVPLLNLLAIPAGIAAAARLWCEIEPSAGENVLTGAAAVATS